MRIVEFAIKIYKGRLYKDFLRFLKSINRKITFKVLLRFVKIALSSKCPASEIYLVLNYIYIPLCKA